MEKTGGEYFSQAVTFWDPKKDGTGGWIVINSRSNRCSMGKCGNLRPVDHLRSEDLVRIYTYSSLSLLFIFICLFCKSLYMEEEIMELEGPINNSLRRKSKGSYSEEFGTICLQLSSSGSQIFTLFSKWYAEIRFDCNWCRIW